MPTSMHQALLANLSNKELQVVNKFRGLKPMKDIIDRSKNKAYDEYFARPVHETHTKEELESLHRAIAYTKMFKQDESLAKMDLEEEILRPIGAKFYMRNGKRK